MARRRRPPRSGAISELPPLKILSQILALQALYYTVAFALTLFTSLVAGTKFSLDLVFSWQSVRGDTTQGWVWAFLWVVDGGLFMAIAIVLLVARSKLVLDFALSMHAIHLVVVTLYARQVPRNAAWWLAMAASSALGVALGVWGCRYRELRPITFGGGGGSSANKGQLNGTAGESGGGGPSSHGGADGVDGDEEQGFARGRGRGRGRDGAGDYEMVQMDGGGER